MRHGIAEMQIPRRDELYTRLEPIIDRLERRRRGHLLFTLIVGLAVALLAGLCGAAMAVAYAGEMAAIPGFAFYALLALTGITVMFDRDFRRSCKRTYNRELARAMKIRYEPMGTFNIGALHHHYIMPPFARGLTEDSLSLRYRGRLIRMQEVVFARHGIFDTHFLRPRGYTGRRGLIILIPARRDFPVHTLALSRRIAANERDRLRFKGMQDYERIPFGNRRFSEKFYVMSFAGDEAHFVLDPALIENILALESALKARSLSISFRDRQIMIYAEHPRNFMEAGSLLRPVNLARAEEIITDIQMLCALVDHLPLNDYVGV